MHKGPSLGSSSSSRFSPAARPSACSSACRSAAPHFSPAVEIGWSPHRRSIAPVPSNQRNQGGISDDIPLETAGGGGPRRSLLVDGGLCCRLRQGAGDGRLL